MKNTLIILILLLTIGVATAETKSQLVISSDDSFSFKIPDGWSLVSNEVIASRKSAAEEQLNSKASSTLDFVLKKENAEDFHPPFIIINKYYHGGRLTEKKFKKKYSLNAEKKVLHGLSGEAIRQGIVSNLDVDGKIYDEQNKTFLMRGKMVREGVGNLDSILAILLGKTVLVNVTFSDFQNDYGENVSAFESVLSSVQFRADVKAKKANALSWWQKDLIKVVAWFPLLAVVCFVSWLSNKLTKMKK